MKKNNKVAPIGVIVTLFIVIFLVALALTALLTMWAWNLVMPFLFHLPQIGFWMAVAIDILLGLIKPVFSYATK